MVYRWKPSLILFIKEVEGGPQGPARLVTVDLLEDTDLSAVVKPVLVEQGVDEGQVDALDGVVNLSRLVPTTWTG